MCDYLLHIKNYNLLGFAKLPFKPNMFPNGDDIDIVFYVWKREKYLWKLHNSIFSFYNPWGCHFQNVINQSRTKISGNCKDLKWSALEGLSGHTYLKMQKSDFGSIIPEQHT